jgi:hypothetical protein
MLLLYSCDCHGEVMYLMRSCTNSSSITTNVLICTTDNTVAVGVDLTSIKGRCIMRLILHAVVPLAFRCRQQRLALPA